MPTLIQVYKKDTPILLLLKIKLQHFLLYGDWIGPNVQKENSGVNKTAGYLLTSWSPSFMGMAKNIAKIACNKVI